LFLGSFVNPAKKKANTSSSLACAIISFMALRIALLVAAVFNSSHIFVEAVSLLPHEDFMMCVKRIASSSQLANA
jgi:hypothetical protein